MKKRLSCFVLALCMLFSLLPALPLTAEAASTVKASDAVSVARSLIGYKYVWGGKSPSAGGFDCSGLIYYIYHDKLGYDIAYSQIQSRSALLKVGTKITNVKDFLPGDIIHGTTSGNFHLGLCTGNGKMIDAGTSKGVSERAYQNSWWTIDYAVRLPGVTQGSVVGRPTVTDVSASGTSVTVKWTQVANATSYDVYLLQAPNRWEDIKYSHTCSSSENSYTFRNVASGQYKAFVIARPNDNMTQSNAVSFEVGVGRPTVTDVLTSGTSVTVKWTQVANATSYDVYLLQAPNRWEDIKYSHTCSSSENSYTFRNVPVDNIRHLSLLDLMII